MSTQKNRLNKLSRYVPNADEEPLFCYWLGHPWTEEEKAEALRKFPGRKMYWKRLSESTPLEDQPLQ